jgi:anti-anti-sigma regulatory factor
MEPTADPIDCALPAEFGIYTVAQVRRDLADALEAAGSRPGAVLALEAARVEQVDGAALQLLVVFGAELRRRGMRLQLVDPSEPLCRAIHRFGAGPMLGIAADARTA